MIQRLISRVRLPLAIVFFGGLAPAVIPISSGGAALAAHAQPAITARDHDHDVYPKAGKIVLGLPHWNKRTHRFDPIAPQECERQVAAFLPNQPVSWAARLIAHTRADITVRIFLLGQHQRIVRRTYQAQVSHAIAEPLIHAVLTHKTLKKLHMTAPARSHRRYSIQYLSGKHVIARGIFEMWDHPIANAVGY